MGLVDVRRPLDTNNRKYLPNLMIALNLTRLHFCLTIESLIGRVFWVTSHTYDILVINTHPQLRLGYNYNNIYLQGRSNRYDKHDMSLTTFGSTAKLSFSILYPLPHLYYKQVLSSSGVSDRGKHIKEKLFVIQGQQNRFGRPKCQNIA